MDASDEIYVSERNDAGLRLGAAVPIQRLLELAQETVDAIPAEKTIGLRQLVWHGQWVAGIQVRNAGSIGGNIFIVKSHTRAGTPFPSDLLTVLGTLHATVTIVSRDYENGRRTYPIMKMPAGENKARSRVRKIAANLHGNRTLSPSSGTPEEGRGGGFLKKPPPP